MNNNNNNNNNNNTQPIINSQYKTQSINQKDLFQHGFIQFLALIILLFGISLSAKAAVNFTSDNQLIGITCTGPNICLSGLTIENKIYGASGNRCVTPSADGLTCLSSASVPVYGSSSDGVLSAAFNSIMTTANTYSQTSQIVDYKNCITYADGTKSCEIWSNVPRVNAQGNYISYEKTGNFGNTVFRNPTVLNNGLDSVGNFYIPGLGLSNPNTVNGKESTRDVIAIKSSCNTCKDNVSPSSANPVDLTNGKKIDSVQDFKFPFSFSRNYSSGRKTAIAADAGVLGFGWKHQYERSLKIYNTTKDSQNFVSALELTLENDDVVYFVRSNATENFKPVYQDYSQVKIKAVGFNYELTDARGRKETYNDYGKLTSIVYPGGYTLTLSYAGSLLTQIMDSYSRWIAFDYSAFADVIIKATSSAGDVVDYTYSNGFIASKIWNKDYSSVANNTVYTYANNLLVTKSNARSQVFASYVYGSGSDSDKVVSNTLFSSNGTNPIKTLGFTYTGTNTTLTDGGATKSYSKSIVNFRPVNTNISYNPDGNVVNILTQNYNLYSGNGYGMLSSKIDVDGNNTSYTYDNDGYLYQTTRNSVTTTYTWDKINNLILQTARPSAAGGMLTTTFTYTNNLLTQKVISDGVDVRTWTYAYGTLGKIQSVNNPDGSKLVYTYYSDTDSTNNFAQAGLIKSVAKYVNGVWQTTNINSYDNRGNPTQIVDYKGLTQNLTYDDYSNVLTQTTISGLGSSTNSYTYDADGNILSSTLANGYSITMTYDAMNRVLSITDNASGSVALTYDANDNVINNSVYNGTTLIRTKNEVYDSINRLKQSWYNNSAEKDVYTYSYSGYKPTAISYSDGTSESFSYNKSLVSSNAKKGMSKDSTYNNDELETNTTVAGVNYTRSFNAFGEIVSYSSANTGTDNISYNIPNRVITKTDASGVVQTSNYDELGRVISINAGSLTKAFTYDTNNVIASANTQNATIVYASNNAGLIDSKTQTVTVNGNNIARTINYGFDNVGQNTTITYPSGMVITNTFSNGKISSMGSNILGGNTNVLSTINYFAMTNTPKSWTFGNALTYSKSMDLNAKIPTLTDGPLSFSYTQDGKFKPTNITLNGGSSGLNSNIALTYNANGFGVTGFNKTGVNATNKTYRYSGDLSMAGKVEPGYSYGASNVYATNKLNNFNNGIDKYLNFVYDVKGNLTNYNSNQAGKTIGFSYNEYNRLTSATKNAVTTNYIYNALDERVAKIKANGESIVYIYNENKQLAGEYKYIGGSQVDFSEYIYINNRMVAVNKNNNLYYVHNDLIETPRVLTNTGGVVVWSLDYADAFNNSNLPSGSIEFNPRFMGQYYDAETELSYNYYRYYSNELGRYIQSDPIGLAGGWNTYAYVENESFSSVDPLGLNGGYINFGLIEGKDVFTDYLFGYEELSKEKFSILPNILDELRLLSHGSQRTLNQYNPTQLSQQIINGKYYTQNGLKINNYFQEQILKKQRIRIVLEACNTGLINGQTQPFGEELAKILRKNLNDNGMSNIKLEVIAPNGTVSMGIGPYDEIGQSSIPRLNGNAKWRNFNGQ